jgi:hypothetical protein
VVHRQVTIQQYRGLFYFGRGSLLDSEKGLLSGIRKSGRNIRLDGLDRILRGMNQE